MTVAEFSFPKAFRVRFRDLRRFDPASFHGISWHWSKDVMFPIGSALKLRKEKVDRAEYEFSQLQPITIHFDGTIDKRKVEGRGYSMDLFFARPGDIVVAKIDLKNGAVGIVPDWENVVVTNHFAVYEPDRSKIIPEYFLLVIQANFFKSYLWRNKVGAEGRKEVKLEFFESIKIPMPSLDEQRRIVAAWQQAQEKAAQAQARVVELEQEIESRFFGDLGLKPPKKTSRLKSFAVWWKDFERWSVSYSQAAQSGTDITRGKYPVHELGSLLEFVQYGTSEKANTSEDGTPVIRMNNIVDGVLDLSDLKHVKLIERDRERLLLKNNDILFNRTNSKELVGKCAVFHENGDYVFASYLIRIRPDPAKADSDFVAYVINSSIGRQQINAISRQIIGQANVNSEELRSLQIPLPPLDVQKEIMRRVEEGRSKIRQEQEAAAKVAEEAQREVERMILGLSKA